MRPVGSSSELLAIQLHEASTPCRNHGLVQVHRGGDHSMGWVDGGINQPVLGSQGVGR